MFDESVKGKLNTSCEIINSAIRNGPDAELAPVFGQYIDVRDVAKAHLLAFQREDTIGKRLLMSEGDFNTQDIVNQLNADFPVLKGKIPVGNPAEGVNGKKAIAQADNSKTKALLGFKFRSLKETVDDTAAQILKHEGMM